MTQPPAPTDRPVTVRGPVRYYLRRLQLFFLDGDHWRRCGVPRCPEVQVGMAAWCREHTDQILEHRHSPELIDALRARGFGPVGTTRVVVGVDYETEHPWVWLADDPDRQAEGYGAQFAADVPTVLVDAWREISKTQDELLTQIHAAARFDPANFRIGDAACGTYVGEPFTLPRGVIYDDCDACGWAHDEHDGNQ